jgi:patatin-like phospholipase/acyl hydrolase
MKLLVLDGGGVFGIGQARILDKVDTSKFDAIIGTSIGAANGAAVAAGLTDDRQLTRFFHEEMPKIFKGYWYKRYKIVTPRHNDKALNKALKELYGNLYLGDVKKPLFITSVNTKTEKLKVFHSGDPADASHLIWETVRCSTAAPTYFPTYKSFTDGGVYANYPAVAGIAGVCDEFGCKLEDIEICSIGTGKDHSVKEIKKWSYLSWGLWLLQAMLNGSSSSMNDFICRQLPLKKYERIQFTREPKWAMDSAADMLKAEAAWEDDIQRGIEIVNNF